MLLGFKIVKERPTTGCYTRFYTFQNRLWSETIEVCEDEEFAEQYDLEMGCHYAYNNEADEFTASPARPLDVKFIYAVEDK